MATSPYDLGDPPSWDATAPSTVAACRAAFEHAHAFTLGVEEELMLVDPETLDLAPIARSVLDGVSGDRRFAPELRAAQLEIITPVCASAADACREVAHARRDLLDALDGRVRLLAAGTHPFSRRHGEVTDADRYRRIADEYTWAATRSLVCGLHIHVAVPGADRALAVYNALRSYLPELAALGANSPYAEAADTNMASIRPKFNEIYPRSGVPPYFRSWSDLVRFISWGRQGGLFPDATHFWWEMRPHLLHGTIEIRVADTQTRVDDATAIVAVVQSLVAMLAERYDEGRPLPRHETFWINENSWRAYRYGVRGWIVDLDTGEQIPTRERIAALIDEIEPYAEHFGTEAALRDARALLAGNGADRQRYVHERDGIDGLTRWLVDETERSPRDA